MVFREEQFPAEYTKGARGGDEFKTRILETAGGIEDRNIRWSTTRGRWDISHLLQSIDETIVLQNFWLAVGHGRAYGFRFKWWADFCADMVDWESATSISTGTSDPTNIATLPLIGTGDSTTGSDGTAAFQLIKIYAVDSYTYTRTIYKPVVDSVRVWVDGVEKTVMTHFTVDTTTGIVTFTNGNHPLTGEIIRAWYEYDFPVRFNSDLNEILFEAQNSFGRTDWPNVEVVEIKNAA